VEVAGVDHNTLGLSGREMLGNVARMELTVLGSSGSYPSRGNPSSGYLVRSGGTSLLVDVGTGTFMSLIEHIDPEALEGVIVSHVHPDHCTDLFGLYSYLYRHVPRRVTVPVFVPHDAVGLFTGFMRTADPDHPFLRVLDFRVVGTGSTDRVGEMELTFGRTAHPVPTNAVRIEAMGRVLTYSADTGPGGEVPRLAGGCDVLLCEAALSGDRTEDSFPFHLTASEAGELAATAGARRLILTHLPPSLNPQTSLAEARSKFGHDPEWAAPGLVTNI
jgi:ribonuclease BN (tRNA processing enzyme)